MQLSHLIKYNRLEIISRRAFHRESIAHSAQHDLEVSGVARIVSSASPEWNDGPKNKLDGARSSACSHQVFVNFQRCAAQLRRQQAWIVATHPDLASGSDVNIEASCTLTSETLQ